MNVHNKTQLTHARINCILKDSSCDTPLSKILKLTILTSDASSSSSNIFKCPHTKNDSIFTHNGLPIFSNQQLFQLTQDQKGHFKACNGAECKGRITEFLGRARSSSPKELALKTAASRRWGELLDVSPIAFGEQRYAC
ncbi:hypothetical protein H5410_028173 [Solanum commersonii]|uniref:GCM domain-containing protein n=1 Tax=Solanum commersonii TaxID=4109 RepID=A0A9J5Z1B3_SOLCO|nr:hypothetical protein H5410_028173 [Solanum commersonii]